MTLLARFRRSVPVTVKVPVLVAILMVIVGTAASQLVLSRLVEIQERQLSDLADAYLDGLQSALIDPVIRRDSWEIFDTLDRAKVTYQSLKPVETIVTDANGQVLAASDPRKAPIGSDLPIRFRPEASPSGEVTVVETARRSFAQRAMVVEGRQIGAIHTELDISPLMAERETVFWTLLGSNAIVTLALALLGWFTVSRMVAPMRVFLEHVRTAEDGSVEPIPDQVLRRTGAEWKGLFGRFNRMATAVSERQTLLTKLSGEEQLSSLGRLASSVAHEVNNPLGGIFNALDTLKMHGSDQKVRSNAIDLIERGLVGIREVVGSILTSYRRDATPRRLQANDLEDLVLLVGAEVRRKQISLDLRNELPAEVSIDAMAIRQVVLNLLINACRVSPVGGRLEIKASVKAGCLDIEVDDAGPGLPPSVLAYLNDGDASTPMASGSGLGLWVAKKTAKELNGALLTGKSALGGARIRLVVPTAREENREIVRAA